MDPFGPHHKIHRMSDYIYGLFKTDPRNRFNGDKVILLGA